MITEYFAIPYDEEALTNEEINKLEQLGYDLYCQFEKKISDMGLTLMESIGVQVTKFSKEELDAMPKARRLPNGSYEIIK